MAFFLRSTKLVHNLAGFVRKTSVLTIKRKKTLFAEYPNIINFNKLRLSTAALISAEKNEEEQHKNFNFDKLIFQLSRDVKNKNVSLQNFEEVFEAIKQKGEITYSQIMLLLSCCSEVAFMCTENERIKMAEDIWNTARELGTEFDISHYNALLAVFVVNHHKFSPTEFLNSLKEANLEPNLVTYKRLLKSFCQQGNIEGARGILNEMRELNHPLSEYDFHSLIQGYCEVGDFDKATEVFNVMQDKDIVPTSKAYVYLLCGYAKHGQIEKLEEVLNELLTKEIFLTDSDYLEIIYTLAVNEQNVYIDNILKRITKDIGFERIVARFIQRLFHKRLDSLALKLLENIDLTEKPFYLMPNFAKNTIDHFIAYREPNEVLKICHDLEEKGFAKAPIGYALKQIFLSKDLNFCMNFLRTMRKHGIKIRNHFYWPVIIKASKQGNSALISFLKSIPEKSIMRCSDSVGRIILPNYNLGENWREESEKLLNIGIDGALLGRHLLENFLLKAQLIEAENISATFPVNLIRLKNLFILLFGSLKMKSDNVDRLVNILYNLAHDHFCLIEKNKSTENFEEEIKQREFFDDALNSLLNVNLKDEIVLQILQGMLEKKMGISSATGSLIIEALKNQNGNNLVSSLTNPQLKFELDNNIKNVKVIKEEKSKALTKLSEIKSLSSLSEEDVESILKELDSNASLKDIVPLMLILAKNKKFDEAVALAERFSTQIKEKNNLSKLRSRYRFCLVEFSKGAKLELTEKIFHLGITMEILKKSDYFPVVRSLLHSGNISLAIQKYCDYVLNTGKHSGSVELLAKLISVGNTEGIKKITDLVTEMYNKTTALSFLVISFAYVGELSKAKKILDTKGFKFSEQLFYSRNAYWIKEKNAEILENFLEIFKDIEYFDRVPLYKMLIEKYVRENEVKKIDQLWLKIQDDNISDHDFLQKMSEFMKNPKADFYKYFDFSATTGMTNFSYQNITSDPFDDLIRQRQLDKAFKVAMTEEVLPRQVMRLLKIFAIKGKVFEVLELLKTHQHINNIKKVAIAFTRGGKINEYFEFLSHFVNEGEFSKISDCFNVGCLLPVLQKDDTLFAKYKSLAIQCLNDGYVVVPLMSYFVNCVKMNGKLKEAEEVLDKFSDHLRNVPFSEIRETVEMTEWAPNFYENFLSSPKLKMHFSDHLCVFYNKLIMLKCDENKIDDAVNYLNKALSEGIEEYLEEQVISLLNIKLKEIGKSFPAPKLLSKIEAPDSI